jgi:hypothetical protein
MSRGFVLLSLVVSACGEPQTETTDVATPAATPAAAGSAPTVADIETPPAAAPGPIPADYRGVWAVDRADCAAEPGLTRIAVAASAIRFYEGSAVVLAGRPSPEGGVELDVDHLAEGQTTRAVHVLQLIGGKDFLTYRRNGEAFPYKRCDLAAETPATPPPPAAPPQQP